MYLVLIFVTVICCIFQLPVIQNTVQWDAQAIISGQWWRILTGNFGHTNIWHLAMNLTGLWVISYLFSPTRKQLISTLIGVSSLVGVLLLFSDYRIYLGLSGTLHGIFGYFALSEALRGRKSSWLLVLGLLGKVSWELYYGASITTSSMIAAKVAVEAHLAGAISGLIGAYCIYAWHKLKK